MTERADVLFCWSGGKDSAMALHVLRQQKKLRVAALLTTVTEGYERISMHGVRRTLLLRQVEAIGLPLQEVRIPPQCINATYERLCVRRCCCKKKTTYTALPLATYFCRICVNIANGIWRNCR